MTTSQNRKSHHRRGMLSRRPFIPVRRMDADGERGSMPMLLMVMLVGLVLGGLLVPMIINQDRATRFSTTRIHALDAAQAGIDTVLGQIRDATTSGVGDAKFLPCGPISGAVGGFGVSAYSVTVSYYTSNPVANPTATAMQCVSGYGTYETTSNIQTPSYALISATGTDGTGTNGGTTGRTLTTTYVFKTTNINIPGGTVRIYPANSSSPNLCWDAGSSTPVATTVLTLQTCSATSPTAAKQTFAYRSDLSLQLASSITATYPNGLCVDTAQPATNGNSVQLTACGALGSPSYSQQWSFNDSGGFTASLSNSKTTGTLSGVCITAAAQTINQALTVANCDSSVTSPTDAWIPTPYVGAGAAAAPQLVNYFQFGRCLDVTGQNTSTSFLIAYPCKQNPNAASVLWNQKFTYNALTSTQGQLITTNGSNYCLSSPQTVGGNPTVKTCNSSDSKQKWTVHDGNSGTYAIKYTIVDSTGLCLGVDVGNVSYPWYYAFTETCDGSTAQKWNANPNDLQPQLQDTHEN